VDQQVPLGFSVKGKANLTNSPSPRHSHNTNQDTKTAPDNSILSFLESEARQKIQFNSVLPVAQGSRSQHIAVVPPRPRTPGELLPGLIKGEISKQRTTKMNTSTLEPNTDNLETRISDADKFILQGEPPSLNAMLLPVQTRPEPETTMTTEPSTLPGKRNYTQNSTIPHTKTQTQHDTNIFPFSKNVPLKTYTKYPRHITRKPSPIVGRRLHRTYRSNPRPS
jgi:hypothetical protein